MVGPQDPCPEYEGVPGGVGGARDGSEGLNVVDGSSPFSEWRSSRIVVR